MAKPNPKAKLGSGGRFASVEASARASGARNPAAVAAAAGRKKYGARQMAEWAAKGRKSTHGSGPMSPEHLMKGYRVAAGPANPALDYRTVNPTPTSVPASVAARPAKQAPVGHMPPRTPGRMKGAGATWVGPMSHVSVRREP